MLNNSQSKPASLTHVGHMIRSPWAIMPERLLEINAIYAERLKSGKIDLDAIEKALGGQAPAPKKNYDIINNVAIVPIHGIIAKRINILTRISGGVSTQLIQRDVRLASQDPDIKGIILDVDSPGGTVDGTEELANFISEATAIKPVIAYTDGLMASAAYWIASSADMVYISGETPTVGSIGVVTAHTDYSGYEEKLGVKTTEIVAGRYKRIASEYSPLSVEGRQYLQDQVDYLYSVFVLHIAANRPGKVFVPKEGAIPWADGRIWTGRQSISAGLVDGISTLDEIIERINADSFNFTTKEGISLAIRNRLQ